MEAGRMKRLIVLLLGLAVIAGGSIWMLQRRFNPPVQTVVSSSLAALQEQNRLSAFAARFVTVVTSSKTQLGFSAEKTLILPAMIRYEVDMARLRQQDLSWDKDTNTLSVRLPPIQIAGPEFDLGQAREYGSGAVLMALTDVEASLDAENKAKAREDVIRQAAGEVTMKLAREATVRAVQSSFAMPLAAAGIEAKVNVTFAGR